MQERSEKLTKKFSDFRQEKAAKEREYLSCLLVVDKYIDSFGDDVGSLKRDILGNKELKRVVGKAEIRIPSSLLYLKFNIEDNVDKLSGDNASDLQAKLRTLSKLLGDLYTDYTKDTKKNADTLFAIFTEIIKFSPRNKNDASILKKVLLGGTVILIMFNRTLPTLNWLVSRSLNMYGLSAEDLISKVVTMLQNIDSKMIELETIIQQKEQEDVAVVSEKLVSETETTSKSEVVEVRSEQFPEPESTSKNEAPVVFKTMESAEKTFKERAIELLKAGAGEPLNVYKLVSDLGLFHLHGSRILELKQEYVIVQADQKALGELSQKLHMNKEKITGRLYVTDIIQAHPEAFRVLQKLSAQDKGFIQLNENLSQINNPNAYQFVVSKGLNLLSTLAAPTNILYRAVTPAMVQEAIASRVPDTMDSESKRLLEQVVEDRLEELDSRLQQIDSGIRTYPSESYVHAFHDLLVMEKVDDLQKMDGFFGYIHSALENSAKIEKRSLNFIGSPKEEKLAPLPEDQSDRHSLQAEINSICLRILDGEAETDQKLDELHKTLQTFTRDLHLLAEKRNLIERKKKEVQQASDEFKKGLFDHFNIDFVTRANRQLEALLDLAEKEDRAYMKALINLEQQYPSLKDLIQQQSIDEIEEVVGILSGANEAVVKFTNIRKEMKGFEQLSTNQKELDAFLKLNDVWTTHLWNWLVELFTKSKSKTMQTMDDVRAFNVRLAEAKEKITGELEQAKFEMTIHFSESQHSEAALNGTDKLPKAEIEPEPVDAVGPRVKAEVLLSQSKAILFKIKGKSEHEITTQDENSLKNN